MIVIPLVGNALASGDAAWAFVVLAVFVALSGLASLAVPGDGLVVRSAGEGLCR